jgi:hypothetical protein
MEGMWVVGCREWGMWYQKDDFRSHPLTPHTSFLFIYLFYYVFSFNICFVL